MHCYAVLQAFVLAITALIFFQAQENDALPRRLPAPEPLASTPPARAARQLDLNHNRFQDFWSSTRSQNLGFKVFPKKNRLDLHPISAEGAKKRVDLKQDEEAPAEAPAEVSTEGAGLSTESNGEKPEEDKVSTIDLTEGLDISTVSKENGEQNTEAKKEGSTEGLDKSTVSMENGEKNKDAAKEGSTNGASAKGSNVKGHAENRGHELTVNIPKFRKNKHGDMEYHPWGVTYGNQFMDPRFRFQKPARPKLIVNPVKNYYPSMTNLTEVCANRTTIYNEVKIEKWLMRSLSSKKKTKRPFFSPLRRELFDKGESESCHNSNYNDWAKYQACAMRRNQRMEYYIPKYPRQQLVLH